MFFSLPSWAVALIVFGVIGTVTDAGDATGRYLRCLRGAGIVEPVSAQLT